MYSADSRTRTHTENNFTGGMLSFYGSSECSSSIHWEKRRAMSLIEEIKNLGLDPSWTLVMKRLQLPATDALKEVIDRILPDVCCFENFHECDPREDLVATQCMCNSYETR